MIADICSIMYNEEDLLPMWIETWLSLPFINKIYLIDGGSTDNSVEIGRSYDKVNVSIIPWKNDFAKQRNLALKKTKNKIKWVIQPDIDEIPCGNLNFENFEKYFNEDYDELIIPYVKFFDWNTVWIFKNQENAYLEHGKIPLIADKSTTTFFKKKCLAGYRNSLHEMPVMRYKTKKKIFSHKEKIFLTKEEMREDFFLGHFDQAKHAFQSKKNNTSIHYEMGLKRLRYRLIKPAEYNGKIYDQQWAQKAISNKEMIEELGRVQLESFKKEHLILKEDFYEILSCTAKNKIRE